jgi:hypothetical protein
MDYSTKRRRIKVAIEWLKGMKMDIPHSKWVMFCIGVYVLAAAFDKLAAAAVVLAPMLR